jgi:4-methylaminobutanoate oxidase (formaldehyde-forming)
MTGTSLRYSWSDDWDQFEIFMVNGIQRCPALEQAGIVDFTVVPESFTPDNKYMLGEAPGVKNFYSQRGRRREGDIRVDGRGPPNRRLVGS